MTGPHASTSNGLARREPSRVATPASGRRRISTTRIASGPPVPGSRAPEPQDDRTVGATELGMISVANGVIATIASRAVLDVADAGGVAPTVLGVRLPGGHLGVRETSLDSLPKTTASVDGTSAFITTTVSVRWPAPIAEVADQVRASIRTQVEHMASVTAAEIEIHVDAVTARPPARPRVQ